MDVLNNLFNGLSVALSLTNIMLLLGGVMLGMIVGVMPGLGPTAGIAVTLPMTFGLDPTGAIILLAAIYYGAMYGGSISAILINTPGDAAAVATTFDGYPLAKKGKAGTALITAAVASFAGGTIGVILITLAAPAAAVVASKFGPAELFLMVVGGLLTLIAIIGQNWKMGLVSILIGFGLATVGVDIGGGEQRYTFGSPDLISGVHFVPVSIGLFGVSQILYMILTGEHRHTNQEAISSTNRLRLVLSGSQLKRIIGPASRTSVLGFIVGIIPGSGATVAALLGYNFEKSISRRPSEFGQGCIQGVAAPEAANNAATSGAMVPLLTLGIPGSAATAMLMGGFLMWGLTPGPLLMTEEPEFAWGLIASMYLGNTALLCINFFAVPFFAKIAKVPFYMLAPVVIVLSTIGAYSVHGSMLEVWIMMLFGVFGVFMRLFSMSPAALVIALILGPMAEQTLRQTMIISGGDFGIFLDRTASLVIIGFFALFFTMPFLFKKLPSLSKIAKLIRRQS